MFCRIVLRCAMLSASMHDVPGRRCATFAASMHDDPGVDA